MIFLMEEMSVFRVAALPACSFFRVAAADVLCYTLYQHKMRLELRT